MNNYQSIATINAPEFINLEPLDINPMMSKCDVKVLYLGKNRNGTSITKEAASEMAKTLRGAPIVGYYRDDKDDFFDHGEQMIFDGDGIHFNSLTKPYGFVSPDAKVWFQEFQETDEAGREVTRVYMMTTGYLWTGQYKEAEQVLNDGGKAQSMELDEKSMSGFWAKEANSNLEFFIINDAVFSKLCILGDDVEPCFEGASITAPNISKTFTLDEEFKTTLFSMMKELQYTLQGGNYKVADEIKKKSVDSSTVVEETTPVVEDVQETPVENETPEVPEVTDVTDTDATPDAGDQSADAADVSDAGSEGVDAGSEGSASTDYVKNDNKEDDKNDKDDEKEDSDEKEDKEDKKDDDDDKEKEDKYALISSQYEELQKSYSDLQAKYEEAAKELTSLKEYALKIENEKKDALIAEFYMLSDEDKKDVIEHKAEYSLDDIKSKLAVLCYDKKISYTQPEDKVEDVTVSINAYSTDMPEWLQAVENHKNNQ